MEKTLRAHDNKGTKAPITVEKPLDKERLHEMAVEAWPKVSTGIAVAAAAGGGLLAAALVGFGPAALAGAAGYLAYRAIKSNETHAEAK